MDIDEYLYFADRAFAGMLAAVAELGDDRANSAPALPGANSPWAIAFHCAQVAEYWIGHLIAGRASARDRTAEFSASGTVTELKGMVDHLMITLRADLTGFDPTAELRRTPPTEYQGPDRPLTPTGVLLHVLEELAQHHGQVQLTRDVLIRPAGALS